MIPKFGEQIRRSSQQATDMLLDEHVDIEETAPVDPPVNPPQAPESAAASQAPEPPVTPPGALPPPPPTLMTGAQTPAPPVLPPPPPAPGTPRDGHRGDGGRLGAVVPILLATLGLVAAVIAWRAGVAGSAADDANRAGLDASRERAASVIINEGLTARATEAYLDYERSRRRAEALAAAGSNDQAQLNRMQAAGNWFLVRPEYIDRTGQFQPNQERAALLADDEQQKDIQPLAHFETADAQYGRLQGLIGAGIVVALALPFLTLAEIGRGRLRLVSVIAGVAIFLGGAAMAVTAWL